MFGLNRKLGSDRHRRSTDSPIIMAPLLLIAFVLLFTSSVTSSVSAGRSSTSTTITRGLIGLRFGGRCPPTTDDMPIANCTTDDDRMNASTDGVNCKDDSDCHTGDDWDAFKCCFNGCRRTCRQPVYTACEHQLMSSEKRARSLHVEEQASMQAPYVRTLRCMGDGRFDPVQCETIEKSTKAGNDGDEDHDHERFEQQQCWCVDEGGFEIGGTRVKGSRDAVNCTSPRPCAGHMCRMLCPFDFELDENGCPLCQCRDPCRDVRCPGGTKCHLEIVNCVQDPCPPIPTCKKARSLDNVCPVGRALTVSDKDKLFLCGLGPTKPQCPSFFDCEIQPGRDYGVCCPSPDKLLKPGSCPDMFKNNVSCGSFCHHDMECEGLQKCCDFQDCGGFSCVPMAENTVCLQQRILAELLSAGELVGRGYIPQCSPITGHFETKQCSRNGRVCWCVHPKDGAKVQRTMGPADAVQCRRQTVTTAVDDAVKAAADWAIASNSETNDVSLEQRRSCDNVVCTRACPYGHEVNENGCQTCDCADLCESVRCPSEMQCVVVESDFCEEEETSCDSFPVCKPPPILYAKPGSCPPRTASLISSCDTNATKPSCSDDSQCPEGLKCCSMGAFCESVCIEPLRVNQRLPTMCEYLRDFVRNAVDEVRATAVVLPRPTCDHDGSFERVQCDGMNCWCVDEFGSELQSTRAEASARSKVDCDTAVRRKSCDGLLCRLGCDYGFERDQDDCPICECRNPCQGIECDGGFQCQMVEVNCFGGFCPSVPQCVATRISSAVCPIGDPLRSATANVTRACGPSSPCPNSYFCHSEQRLLEDGVCCEKPVKPGQCPYRFVPTFGHCENTSTCESDHQCPDAQAKCCSDGCKHTCVEPEMKTGCEHAASVARFMSQERSLVFGEPIAPRCEDEDGTFARVQCRGRFCWCVDPAAGREVPGSRTKHTMSPNCTDSFIATSRPCPPLPQSCRATLNCPSGFRLSDKGCPTCSCHDPCEEFLCSKKNEECVSVRLNCINEPCPPVPMCMLRKDNPCPHGHPIKNRFCSSLPGFPNCPSTHVCFQNPILDFSAVCCPKSRDVCFQDPEYKECEEWATVGSSNPSSRWVFSMLDNQCIEVPSGKCPMSTNNFRKKPDCEATCPVLSECERAREKALTMAKKEGRLGFIPKCRKDGNWEPVQCLPEIGLCWCVSRGSGEYMKGSAVRGTPRCGSARMGRRLVDGEVSGTMSTFSDRNGSVCPIEGSRLVHLCNSSLCEEKVCLSRPSAVCRVNPCDGCRYAFHDGAEEVNCEQGLTECQREVQTVLNSKGWSLRVAKFLGHILGAEYDESASKMILGSLLGHDSGVASAIAGHPDERERRSTVVMKDSDFLGLLGGAARPSTQRVDDSEYVMNEKGGDEPDELDPPILSRRPLMMVVMPPRCTSDGDYERVQSQGDLSWCVDAHGMPVHWTLSRTMQLECNVNDLVSKAAPIKPEGNPNEPPICSDPRKSPKVCTDECLRSECPSHPEALCVADPCNECRVRFFIDEQTVNCQERCLQPLEIGMCRAAFPRWHFNTTSGVCEAFMYGGCLGNDNNFESEGQCHEECTKPVDVCSLPKQVGMCRASMKRWWFNHRTQKCERFIFGGCDGNANNFESREQCDAICPDVVLCPRLPSIIDSGLVQCRRSLVCAKATTCNISSSAVCTADPCDCQPYFVDYDGNRLYNCLATTGTSSLLPPSPNSTIVHSSKITTCQKQRQRFQKGSSPFAAPECDDDGGFSPTQCGVESSNTSKCWCVDEAGKRLPDVPSFVRGTRVCHFAKVDSMSVSLIFEHEYSGDRTAASSSDEQLIRREMVELLNGLTASVAENDISVSVLPRVVQVNFTLEASDKVDVAYMLQEKMEAGGVVLQLAGGQNVRPGSRSLVESRLSSTSKVYVHGVNDGDSVAVVIGISLIVVLSFVLLLAIYVGVHNRRTRGYYPRGSMNSLSPVNNFGYGSVTASASNSSWSSAVGQQSVATISESNNVHDKIIDIGGKMCSKQPPPSPPPPLPPPFEDHHHYEVLERNGYSSTHDCKRA